MPLFHPSTFSPIRSSYTKWADEYYKEEEKNKDRVIAGLRAYNTRLRKLVIKRIK